MDALLKQSGIGAGIPVNEFAARLKSTLGSTLR
jgi:hypothetical protein